MVSPTAALTLASPFPFNGIDSTDPRRRRDVTNGLRISPPSSVIVRTTTVAIALVGGSIGAPSEFLHAAPPSATNHANPSVLPLERNSVIMRHLRRSGTPNSSLRW